MFFEEVERSVHKIIGLLHLTVDSEDLPKAIDHTTSDEMCINFDASTTPSTPMGVYFKFWGMSLSIVIGD